MINQIKITGTKISLASLEDLLQFVSDSILEKEDSPRLMASGNVHSFNMAHRLRWYQEFLNDADVVRLDGAGISLAAKLKGYSPPDRSTWADFGWPLLELCEREGFGVFFFGCAPGVAMVARKACLEKMPKLIISGYEHGFIDWKKKNSHENEELISRINNSGTDILIIGLGMPRQERWIVENKDDLTVKIIMTGGAVFNYLSGKEHRAPQWMLNHGLEWLFRFVLEPKRLFSRYIIGNPVFMFRVIKELIQKRYFRKMT